jgi:hypothetical protein
MPASSSRSVEVCDHGNEDLENDARYANCHIVPFGVMAAQECRKTANKLILTTKTPILSVCHRKLGIAAER